MASVTVLPQGTYPAGTRSLGPATVPTGLTAIRIDFDKTAWTDPAITLNVSMDMSLDGGVTWNSPHPACDPFPVGFTAEGGGTDKFGNPYPAVTLFTSLPQPANTQRRIRATVVIAGGSITTNATITTS